MTSIEDCRLRARDAQELSHLVTLGCDRERLRTEARFWRKQADCLQPEPHASTATKFPTAFLRSLASLAQAPRLQVT